MLELVKGCKVPKNRLLFEQYEVCGSMLTANVNACKIQEVVEHFITMQRELVFFILELPSNENDEKLLRKNDSDPFHKDIYYIDGLEKDQALVLLIRYGELLINDGLSRFGFGVQDGTAELMVEKYNIVTLWTRTMKPYADFFDIHQIPLADHCFTAWETFTKDSPGVSERIEINGKTVFDLPEELKDWGIYFAERREE